MTRLEPLSPNSGYALRATKDGKKVDLTFLRSVGYDTSIKNTPAFTITVTTVGLNILLDGLKKYSKDAFTLSVATLPEYAKSNLRIEHYVSFTARRPSMVYLTHVRSDGSHHDATVVPGDRFVAFLEEILANN